MLKKFLHAFSKPPQHTQPSVNLKKTFFAIKFFLLLLTTFVAATAISLWWFHDVPLASPINSLTTFKFLQEAEIFNQNKKIVYGYLPYWNLKKVTLQPELTHLSYFALAIARDGTLITRTDEGGEPGYSGLKSDEFLDLSTQMKNQDGAMEIVLSQFNGDDIFAFLNSPTAQDRLFESLDDIILAYPVNGINIDIELNGSPTEATRNNLTKFMKNLREHMDKRYDKINLSIAMYAGASNNLGLWDVKGIEPYVDYIVVMAYDFHRRTSPLAGPVAPLFGGKDLWDSDINQHLQEFAAQVPRHKLLLGIPFYGYEWETTSRDAQSHTFPDTGATASMSRVADLLTRKEELKVQERWNEDALSPYLSYIEDGKTYVIYYENSRSISYKLDYVNQLDLGGIAIWAVGYEGDSRELWDVINRKL
jgi:spore germination protein YaaH